MVSCKSDDATENTEQPSTDEPTPTPDPPEQIVYLGTTAGVSVSTDATATWTTYTTADGLASDNISRIRVFGDKIYIDQHFL